MSVINQNMPPFDGSTSLPQSHNLVERERLSLSGMHCAACVQLIEFRVMQLQGIISFKINPASHRAELSWDPQKISLQNIISSIVNLGYGALPANQSLDEQEKKENKLAIWRLFVAGFAMMQVMMYAFPAYLVPVAQVDGDLTPDLDKLLKIASMIIAVPVICFSALPFFRAALRDLRHRHIGMDVPVSLGILLTFFASVWATFAGGAVYFDSAIMFVFLLLGARLIESKVQKRTTSAVRVLTQLSPVKAQKLTNYPATRDSVVIEASQLHVGDIVFIAAGEHIPADGIVLEGMSESDESLMTGESVPVSKAAGDSLIAGAVNMSAGLVMRTERVGSETQLSSLIRMMETAATEKPPVVLLADKHASRFLTFILIIAVLAGVAWFFVDPSRALWIAISIIVVTCPCALSLATPGVMSAAIGMLAKNGLLIKNGKAVQTLAEASHYIFDKTGTLTAGKLSLSATHLIRAEDGAGKIAFLLASHSSHPVAKSIADGLAGEYAKAETGQISDIREVAGSGLEATVDGKIYRLGSIGFVSELSGTVIQIPELFRDKTISVLADADGGILLFALEDVLRDDAAEIVRKLQLRGKQVFLLSGDRQEAVQKVAAQCGISHVYYGLSPSDKFDIVKKLQSEGAVVVMIGDGMNDGPVLSLADVAVAMGQGAPISQTRSDVLLMSNRLADLDFGIDVSRQSFRLIRENLAWAILYNLCAIPAAVMGFIEPWHAALGMSLSSLIVVLNALRLYLLPQPERFVTDNLVR